MAEELGIETKNLRNPATSEPKTQKFRDTTPINLLILQRQTFKIQITYKNK